MVLAAAPHICWPLRFVLPHDAHLRPAWMIRAGLFLYDHLARRRFLPGSSGVNLRRHPAGAPLEARYRKGFVYSDAWVDDARLVVITAMDAREHGATVLTRTRCTRLDAPRRAVERDARARGRRHARDRGAGRGERHRPLGGPLPRRRHVPAGRAPPAPGQGQPHRRAEAVRPRVRLHLPGRGRPHRVRDPLRGRLHADRHHRDGLHGRPLEPGDRRVRDRVPARPRQPLLRQRPRCARTWCGRSRDCVRCWPTRKTAPPA